MVNLIFCGRDGPARIFKSSIKKTQNPKIGNIHLFLLNTRKLLPDRFEEMVDMFIEIQNT